jgi:hypothetical protein
MFDLVFAHYYMLFLLLPAAPAGHMVSRRLSCFSSIDVSWQERDIERETRSISGRGSSPTRVDAVGDLV